MGTKGGKVKKSGAKGGAKRQISKIKRSNQRQNKLVKHGKAKPNSKPRYVPNAKKAGKADAETWLTPEVREKWAKSQEDDADAALDQLAEEISGQDAAYIKSLSSKRKLDDDGDEDEGEDSDEEGLGAFERGALERIHQEKISEKEVRGLLPIKTKQGVKQRIEEVEEMEQEDENDEEESSSEDESEDDNKEEPLVVGQEVSVVELYAKRKVILADRKITIGSLASNFLECPQDRIINLEKLVRMVDSDQPRAVELTVHRLAAASVLEILKDVTPGYKISHQEMKEGEKMKKDTLKLVKFETALLKCYKNYLLKLEKLVNLIKSREVLDTAKQGQANFFLSCMCQLLTAHPHFNFATNILHAVVPILSNSNEEARNTVKRSLEEMFKDDMRGEISLDAVRLINHLVKSRKHNVRNEVVSVLLALRIKNVDLDREKNAEIELKKKEARKKKLLEKSTISKQEKKRKKKLESLEKELLEARGEEGKKVKEKFFTETTKMVFTIYFRILKSFPKSKLMGAVLEGLSKFAHIINIEFFSDLVSVFQDLLLGGTLSYRDTLLATGTVFKILSGQGEALNIDPASFYTNLYTTLFSLSATSTNNTVPLALSAMYDMLIRRKKKVSKGRVLAFTKRIGTLALQLDHAGSVGSLAMLRQLHTTHPFTSQLLDSEHEVGSGVFDPTLPDPEHCCASNTTGWEHSLLETHYHPTTARLSRHVVSGCPSQGERSLPAELRSGPDTLYTEYSMERMVFNPPIEPPPKKAKRGKVTPLSPDMALTSEDLQLPQSLDLDMFSLISDQGHQAS